MQEAEVFCSHTELAPMRERSLEQDIGANDVCVNEFGGPVDRSVDVTFGREMHHGIRVKARKNPTNRQMVADVGATELIPGMALYCSKRGKIAGIGQFVDHQH